MAGNLYLWIKAAHVISMVAWMAALFYLPRLYVYHVDAERGSVQSETFKVMERRLFRAIGNPAMIATWIFGLWLAFGYIGWADQPWLHAKIVLVAALTYFHHLLGRWRKDFEQDRNERPAKFYRMANEIPTVLLIGIVILVIVKPF